MLMQTKRSMWDRCLAEYEKRNALLRANRIFGAHRKATDKFEERKNALERQYGHPRATEATTEWDAAWSDLDAAEDAHFAEFIRPADRAAIALVMTPAPDLAAAVLKVTVIEAHELDNHSEMPRDCMAIVLEDMERFGA